MLHVEQLSTNINETEKSKFYIHSLVDNFFDGDKIYQFDKDMIVNSD